jgi:hypothetical protein
MVVAAISPKSPRRSVAGQGLQQRAQSGPSCRIEHPRHQVGHPRRDHLRPVWYHPADSLQDGHRPESATVPKARKGRGPRNPETNPRGGDSAGRESAGFAGGGIEGAARGGDVSSKRGVACQARRRAAKLQRGRPPSASGCSPGVPPSGLRRNSGNPPPRHKKPQRRRR